MLEAAIRYRGFLEDVWVDSSGFFESPKIFSAKLIREVSEKSFPFYSSVFSFAGLLQRGKAAQNTFLSHLILTPVKHYRLIFIRPFHSSSRHASCKLIIKQLEATTLTNLFNPSSFLPSSLKSFQFRLPLKWHLQWKLSQALLLPQYLSSAVFSLMARATGDFLHQHIHTFAHFSRANYYLWLEVLWMRLPIEVERNKVK